MRIKKLLPLLLIIPFLITGILFISLTHTTFAYQCIVERIIDGDTFVCSGEKVRLVGVDTPESTVNPHIEKQRSLGSVEHILYLGRKAKEFVMKIMPPGTRVSLEFDVQQRDRYGRLLAYVWLPDGRMLNEVLLKEGYAMLYTVPPNVKYEERFRRAYRFAVEKRKGLWSESHTFTNEDLEKYPGSYRPKPAESFEVKTENQHKVTESNRLQYRGSEKFECGKKYYCSQMSSCEEAMFYYTVCGLKRLDGDNDGIPCEMLCGYH